MWIEETEYYDLKETEYLYKIGIEPVITQYERVVGIQSSVIILLVVALGVTLVNYFYEKSLKKYYKACLNVNFGWFGKK